LYNGQKLYLEQDSELFAFQRNAVTRESLGSVNIVYGSLHAPGTEA